MTIDQYLKSIEAEVQAIKDQLNEDPEIAESVMIVQLAALQHQIDECPHCKALKQEQLEIILAQAELDKKNAEGKL
jgi:hypothetical protein